MIMSTHSLFLNSLQLRNTRSRATSAVDVCLKLFDSTETLQELFNEQNARLSSTQSALAVALTLGMSATAAAAPMQRADTTVITGRVTSEGGVAIPSAIVTIPARRVSTQTNDAGTFRLSVTGAAARPTRCTSLGLATAQGTSPSRSHQVKSRSTS